MKYLRLRSRQVCFALLTGLGLLSLLLPGSLRAQTVIDNTSSGWYDQTGYNIAGNPNYYTGDNQDQSLTYHQLNDYFTFELVGVSGTVASASFNVYSYSVGGDGIYSIYMTSLTPSEVGGGCSGCTATYDDLTSGSLIGSSE